MPEYAAALMISALLGWGGFCWRRAEKALDAAEQAVDRNDKLELKMAEQYLSKLEFKQHMDQVMGTLSRLDDKLDMIMYWKGSSRNYREDVKPPHGWENS